MIEQSFEEYLKTPIKETDRCKYKKMELKIDKMYGDWKLIFFLLFLLVLGFLIVGTSIFDYFTVKELYTFKWKHIILFLPITVCINFLGSKVVHLIAYYSVIKVYIPRAKKDFWCNILKLLFMEYNLKIKKKHLINIVKALFSPDLHLAMHYKGKLERKFIKARKDSKYKVVENCNCALTFFYEVDNGEKFCLQCADTVKFMKMFFIKYSNWINLYYSVFLMTLFAVLTLIPVMKLNMSFFLLIILLHRLFSRSIEIGTAFYKDIVQVQVRVFKKININNEVIPVRYIHAWRNSYIRKPMRISLALHSLIEIILMFFICYLIIDTTIFQMKLHYAYEFLLSAISISLFNISYSDYKFWLLNVLHVWQIIMSFILIILSIAGYLGFSDEVTEREEEFFRIVLPEIKKAKEKEGV
ncbi:hypothetical protein [Guptibacillus hwajinpoensis]|uniref:hypothetical protein n=1 Tax=Guptibacillus hwajinpoensis TaxID=208199 RepID=UPI001CFE9118|nr:hypothetical protein [Pseudalkalibacillus hwajinpoensis]WLR60177.1 hypothetical protein LC071_01935 [Pseudalkalibacillus hwajinpoensis]